MNIRRGGGGQVGGWAGRDRGGGPRTGTELLLGLMRNKTEGNICDEHSNSRHMMSVKLKFVSAYSVLVHPGR